MIKELATGIKAVFDAASAFNTALSGGLWYLQAKQDVTAPYGVFFFISSTPDEIMGDATKKIVKTEWQFNIVSENDDGGQEAAELVELMETAFNWITTMTVTGYNVVKIQQAGILTATVENEIYEIPVRYEIWLEES